MIFSEASKKFKPYEPVILITKDGFIVQGKEFEILVEHEQNVQTTKITHRKLEMMTYEQEVEIKEVLKHGVQTDNTYFDFSQCRGTFKPIRAKPFKDSLKLLKPCIAKDTARPILCGIYLDDDTLVATDSYRITTRKLEESTGFKGVIPKAAVEVLLKFLYKSIDELYISVIHNYILISFSNIIFKFDLLEGEYLKYQQLFEGSSYEILATVNRKEFVKAIEFFATMPYYTIKDGKEVQEKDKAIIAKNRPLFLEFDESVISDYELLVNYKGLDPISLLVEKYDTYATHTKIKGFKIAFNPWFLLEALKALPEDDIVELQFISDLTPMIIKGKENKQLLLPIRFKKG